MLNYDRKASRIRPKEIPRGLHQSYNATDLLRPGTDANKLRKQSPELQVKEKKWKELTNTEQVMLKDFWKEQKQKKEVLQKSFYDKIQQNQASFDKKNQDLHKSCDEQIKKLIDITIKKKHPEGLDQSKLTPKQQKKLLNEIQAIAKKDIHKIRHELKLKQNELRKEAKKDIYKIKLELDKQLLEIDEQTKKGEKESFNYYTDKMAKRNLDLEKKEKKEKAEKKIKAFEAKETEYTKTLSDCNEHVTSYTRALQHEITLLDEARSLNAPERNINSTLSLYEKVVAETQADPIIKHRYIAAGKKAKAEIESMITYMTKNFTADMETAHDIIKNAATPEERENAVSELLKAVRNNRNPYRHIPQDTRLTRAENDAQVAQRQDMLIAQKKASITAFKLARKDGQTEQKAQKNMQDALKNAVAKTILHVYKTETREKVLHEEIAQRFSAKVEVTTKAHKDALATARQDGNTDAILAIQHTEHDLHEAMDTIAHFSPEISNAIKIFRNEYTDPRPSSQHTTTTVKRETAIKHWQKHQLAQEQNEINRQILLSKINEHIENFKIDDINSIDDINFDKLQESARITANLLRQQGLERESNPIAGNTDAYQALLEHIEGKYTKSIQKLEEECKEISEMIQQSKQHKKKDQQSTVENIRTPNNAKKNLREKQQELETLRTLRDSALTEASRYFPQAAIENRLKAVREQAEKLQNALTTRDQKLQEIEKEWTEKEIAKAGRDMLARDHKADAERWKLMAAKQMKKIAVADSTAYYAASAENNALFIYNKKKDDLRRVYEAYRITLSENKLPTAPSTEGTESAEAADILALAKQLLNQLEQKHSSQQEIIAIDKQKYEKVIEECEQAKEGYEQATKERLKAESAKEFENKLLERYTKLRDYAKELDEGYKRDYLRYLERLDKYIFSTLAYERHQIIMKKHYKMLALSSLLSGLGQANNNIIGQTISGQFNGTISRIGS